MNPNKNFHGLSMIEEGEILRAIRKPRREITKEQIGIYNPFVELEFCHNISDIFLISISIFDAMEHLLIDRYMRL